MKNMNFWRKYGKIITDGTSFIRCDVCPCDSYAVFGIKYKNLDCSTMQPTDADKCRWHHDIVVTEVKNNTFFWRDCQLKVSSQKGLCLQQKGNWNQNCYQVKVYNLTGCYSDYNTFAEIFYTKCDVEVDAEGFYPQIFDENGDVTDAALGCVDEWLVYFQQMYALNYVINYNSYWQRWWWDCLVYFSEQLTDYWCSETQDCYDESYIERNQDGSCPQGTKQCSESYVGQDIGIGAKCYEQSEATAGYSEMTYQYTDDTDWNEFCCIEQSGISAIPAMNETVKKAVADTSIYYLNRTNNKSCSNDNNLCVSFEYRSGCVDNWYGSRTEAKSHFFLYKLSLARNENTPEDAVGVRFLVKKKHIKENVGLGHESYSEQTTNQIYDLYFDGEEKITDLATDVTYFGVIHAPQCNDSCGYADDGGEWQIQPYVMFGWAGYQEWQQNNLYDEFQYELIADRYLTADDLT